MRDRDPSIPGAGGPSASELFRDVTGTLRQVVYVAAYDYSRMFYVSPAFQEVWGLSVDRLYADPLVWLQAVHPEDRGRIEKVVQEGIGRGHYAGEYRVVRPDGSVRWIWDQAWETPGPDGRPERVVGIAEDITERKLRETRLADATAQLSLVAQHAPGILWSVDRRLIISFAGGRLVQALGLDPAVIVGRPLAEYLGTSDPEDPAVRACREALEGKSSVYERVREGRRYRTVVEPLRGPDGRIAGAIGFSVDETERIRGEAELAAWKERYETAIRVSGQIIYDADADQNQVVFGGDTARMLGYEASEMNGSVASWCDRIHPEDRPSFEAKIRDPRSKEAPFHMDYRVRHRNGGWVTVRDDGFPLADGQGVVRRHVGLLKDVTATRRLEEQLFQAQKMESIGRLAGGIAHDFNNLLTTLLGYTEMVLQKTEAGSALRAEVGEIKEAGLRAAGLTRQLLAFSRKQMLKPRVIDVNEVVRGLEKILRRTLGEHIAVEVALADDPGRVRADPSQLEQVLLNLAVNARDAMHGGGRLRISTASCRVPAGSPEDPAGAPAGLYLELKVEDDGSGMDPETRAHLFEPFFTTKAQGHGTGLGLSTVYGIVKQSGGFIEVDSAPGRGTRFRILLPATADDPDPETLGRRISDGPGGSETVLLVEDEDALRELAAEILRREGYAVLKAQDGAEGLERARRHAGPIDLVLTDVVMPELGGPEMVRRLLETRPGLRVLYMSGYTRDALGTLEGSKAELLEKPFTPDSLARAVRRAIDR